MLKTCSWIFSLLLLVSAQAQAAWDNGVRHQTEVDGQVTQYHVTWSNTTVTNGVTTVVDTVQLIYDFSNCSVIGSGIEGEDKLASSLSFSSTSIACNNQYVLVKLDSHLNKKISINNSLIQGIESCDSAYHFSTTEGCITPDPVLTKFNTVASGVEDSLGIQISHDDLLSKSDASLARNSYGIAIGSTLYFNVTTVMNNGTLLINGSAFSDSNNQIRPGGSITYIPDEHLNGSIEAFQVTLENNLGHESLNGVTASVTLSPVDDAPRKITNGSLFVGSGTSSVISESTLRAVDDIDVPIGQEATNEILFRVVSPPTRGNLLNGSSSLTTGSTFTQRDINNGSISYTHLGSGTSDVINLVVESDSGLSDDITFSVNIIVIAGDRGAPIIAQGNSINVTMSENSTPNPFSINLSATNPASGDSLMVWRLGSSPSNGEAEAYGLGRSPNDESGEFINYEPDENFDGTDSFTVVVNNGTQYESTITVNVIVEDVNAAPVINKGSSYNITMSEDSSPTPFIADISATDRDNSDTSLFWDVDFHPLHGTVTLSNATGSAPTINYVPEANYYGSDNFGLKVSDGTSTTTIDLQLYVSPQNDAPTLTEGSNITVNMSEDSYPVPFELELNAVDEEGDDIDWSITQGTNGTASLSGSDDKRTVYYKPQSNFVGTDSFVITVSDQDGSTDNTITVNVQGANDAPVITQGSEISVTMSEDASPIPFSLTLDAADLDDSSSLQWTVLSPPDNGVAAVADATELSTSIYYLPDPDYFGTDSFVIQVSDGSISDSIKVNVNVENVNDAPVIKEGHSISKTVIEDSSLTMNLTATDSDSTLVWQVLQQPDNGSIEFLAGYNFPKKIKYTPKLNFNGPDSFIIAVSDGEFSAQTTVSINVTTKNDAPYFEEGIQTNVTISENSFPTAFKLTLHGIDPEGDDFSWSVDTPPAHGSAKIIVPLTDGRAIDYVPDANYFGEDSFIIKIDDSNQSSTFKVNVTIETDNALVIQRPISDFVFELGETTTQVPLHNVFSDINNSDAIIKNVASNDNENLVSTSISGELLTLSYTEGQVGTAHIKLDGISGKETIQDSFSVTIEDTTPPVFSNTTLNALTYEATGRTTEITPVFPEVTDISSVVVSSDKPDKLFLGESIINWLATDASGNTSSVPQTINIVDTTPPTITLEKPTIQANSNSVYLGKITTNDLVDGDLTATTDASLNDMVTTLSRGNHIITWTAEDSSGNKVSVDQVISVSYSDSPTILVDDMEFEATGKTTTITEEMLSGSASASDIKDGPVIPSVEIPLDGKLPIGEYSAIWKATDSDGNQTIVSQLLAVKDTTPPELLIDDSDITINATGELTTISLAELGISATDSVDSNDVLIIGEKDGIDLSSNVFKSGVNQVSWSAQDGQGNKSSAKEQTIRITPIVNFGPAQLVSAGDTVSVRLILTGVAPSYPVTIAYEVDTDASEGTSGIDHNATSGKITLEDQEIEGVFTFDVSNNPILNGAGEGKLVFSLGELNGVVKGHNDYHIVDIKTANLPPVVDDITLLQGDQAVASFIPDGGMATIVITNPTKELLFNWTSDSELIDLDSNSDTYTFDPSKFPLGSYAFDVEITDNNDASPQTTNVSINFNIIDALLQDVIDSDGNGIPDTSDIESPSNMLPIHIDGDLTLFLLSESGTKVKLGSIAITKGNYNPIINTDDSLPIIPNQYTAILDTHNYQVNGVSNGYAITTILPQNTPIPDDPVYLVFDSQINDWVTFQEDEQNKISSAPFEDGSTLCPPLEDNRYKSGLVTGYSCVSLRVVDGGNNDVDNIANGRITNLGVVVGVQANTDEDNVVVDDSPDSDAVGDGSGDGSVADDISGTDENNTASSNSSGGGLGIPLDLLFLLTAIILLSRMKFRITK